MSSPGTTEAADTAELRHPDVRIEVRNFGPVAAGDLDLRPLTVFVSAELQNQLAEAERNEREQDTR